MRRRPHGGKLNVIGRQEVILTPALLVKEAPHSRTVIQKPLTLLGREPLFAAARPPSRKEGQRDIRKQYQPVKAVYRQPRDEHHRRRCRRRDTGYQQPHRAPRPLGIQRRDPFKHIFAADEAPPDGLDYCIQGDIRPLCAEGKVNESP